MRRLNALLAAMSRAIIASAFWLATRLSNSVKVSGLQYDRGAARSYMAMSHKRDLDPIVLVPTILFSRGWRALAGNVRFFLRGDAFSPGYLARMVMHPRWLSYALRWLPIGAVLRWLGTYPADSLYLPLEEWVREVLQLEDDGGKKRAGDVLASSVIAELALEAHEGRESVASLPLARLLTWKYHHALQHVYGSEILSRTTRRAAQQRVIARVKKHLAELDAWLWRGGSLYASAEGQLSPLGLLSPISAGFHRLLRTAPPETSVVPIFLIYDFMTTQRLRIFIGLAPTIERAPLLPPAELDALLRARWLEAASFTCTQLGSGFLAQAAYGGLASFTLDDLAGNIHAQAKSLAAAGRHVDTRLLDLRKARKRARGFLKYAGRHALVRRSAKGAWTPTLNEVPPNLRPGEVGYDRAPLTYALNELHEMLNGV